MPYADGWQWSDYLGGLWFDCGTWTPGAPNGITTTNPIGPYYAIPDIGWGNLPKDADQVDVTIMVPGDLIRTPGTYVKNSFSTNTRSWPGGYGATKHMLSSGPDFLQPYNTESFPYHTVPASDYHVFVVWYGNGYATGGGLNPPQPSKTPFELVPASMVIGGLQAESVPPDPPSCEDYKLHTSLVEPDLLGIPFTANAPVGYVGPPYIFGAPGVAVLDDDSIIICCYLWQDYTIVDPRNPAFHLNSAYTFHRFYKYDRDLNKLGHLDTGYFEDASYRSPLAICTGENQVFVGWAGAWEGAFTEVGVAGSYILDCREDVPKIVYSNRFNNHAAYGDTFSYPNIMYDRVKRYVIIECEFAVGRFTRGWQIFNADTGKPLVAPDYFFYDENGEPVRSPNDMNLENERLFSDYFGVGAMLNPDNTGELAVLNDISNNTNFQPWTAEQLAHPEDWFFDVALVNIRSGLSLGVDDKAAFLPDDYSISDWGVGAFNYYHPKGYWVEQLETDRTNSGQPASNQPFPYSDTIVHYYDGRDADVTDYRRYTYGRLGFIDSHVMRPDRTTMFFESFPAFDLYGTGSYGDLVIMLRDLSLDAENKAKIQELIIPFPPPLNKANIMSGVGGLLIGSMGTGYNPRTGTTVVGYCTYGSPYPYTYDDPYALISTTYGYTLVLWVLDGPPDSRDNSLRLNQRNDGRGPAGHARLDLPVGSHTPPTSPRIMRGPNTFL